MLLDLIAERGPSSETYGILGRVYKDRWEAASEGRRGAAPARGLLDKAIDAYREGLRGGLARRLPRHQRRHADGAPRPARPAQRRLLPVVRLRRRAEDRRRPSRTTGTTPRCSNWRCWRRTRKRVQCPGAALAAVREPWEPETTASNLRLIREAREERGETLDWTQDIERELLGVAVA